jgi:hypothetical protein
MGFSRVVCGQFAADDQLEFFDKYQTVDQLATISHLKDSMYA